MRKTNLLLVLILSFILLSAQEKTIKVSSFNVRNENSNDAANGNGWTNRYPEIANIILFHDLDIVGTQECKSNQITDLLSVLSKYNYNYIGRGRGTNPTDDEYSAIFYKTDKYKLMDSGNFWLSETPDIPSKGWDAALNRICTWGKFKDKSTHFVFYVFNLHMDHQGKEARRLSSELVIKEIKEITKGKPVVLTGDFNTDQFAEGYKIITNSETLLDSYTAAKIIHDPNGTFNGFDINNTTNQRIDHVFISKHFTTLRYGVLTDIYWTDKSGIANHPRDFPDESTVCVGKPRMPSDHYPIVVVVKY